MLDLVLPEGDGFAVVDHLRSGAAANVPLLVYTALDLDAADATFSSWTARRS